MSKKIGVILSGCGYLDGAEIRESVITLLSIDSLGAEAICMAPNIDQMHVVNHITGEEMEGQRNVLIESARIARGEISEIKEVNPADLDGLILPGGYGVAKNLSDFATQGGACHVQPDVSSMMREMMSTGKPIGVICIAPAVMAKVAQETGKKITLTIGNDVVTASALEGMGVVHAEAGVEEIVIDKDHKIVSTPAYMCQNRLSEISRGIEKLVQAVVEMS